MNFTDEQRLIVIMLAEVGKKLGVNDGLDYGLISKAAAWKHDWAIAWEHSSIFDSRDTPREVGFVADVLDMFWFLEEGYKRLSGPDQDQVKAANWNSAPHFDGFDGNNESELMGICQTLVEDMGRFDYLKGRGFNSHMPREGKYTKMLGVFNPLRQTVLQTRSLDAYEIISVLQA